MERAVEGRGSLLRAPVSWKWQATHTHETVTMKLPKENMNKADREANVWKGKSSGGPTPVQRTIGR